MTRKILFKISEETRTISPSTRQWAGMQYENNATEVVFDLSALNLTNALCRIDFNSVIAGYQPSENLTPDENGYISRSIPEYITQYGEELQVTAVVTFTDEGGAAICEVLSFPATLYFTEVERDELGETEITQNISEMEESVKNLKNEVEQKAESVSLMHDELIAANVSAEELLAVKESAEEIIAEIATYGAVGMETEDGGEIFGDYIVNDAIGEGSAAFGFGTVAGNRAFKILNISPAEVAKTYNVTVRGDVTAGDEPYEVGDVLQITANVNFNNSYKIASITVAEGNSVLGIDRVDNRSVQAMSLAEEHPNNTENWLYVAGKSGGELTPWLISAAAFGEAVTVTGEAAIGAGYMNTVSGDFAAGFGRNNTVGYAALTAGAENETGDYGFAVGNGNSAIGINAVATGVSTQATKYASRAGGSGTLSRHEFAVTEGLGTKSGRQAQLCVGTYNKGRANTLFEVGNGTGATSSERNNAFEVYEDGSVAVGGVILSPEKLTALLALVAD